MTNITPPSEAEAQHIGTFWVLNLDQELGTGPGREADIEPYRATGSAREADIEQEQEADTGPGRGQAPALVPRSSHDFHGPGSLVLRTIRFLDPAMIFTESYALAPGFFFR